jgi:hypothetical protein
VLTYDISFTGLTGPMSDGHLHLAPAGTNGPVRHGFDNRPLGQTTASFSGDWRFDDAINPLTDALATSLVTAGLYANIHTSTFPGGEVRGQVLVVPEPAAAGLLVGAAGLVLRRRSR